MVIPDPKPEKKGSSPVLVMQLRNYAYRHRPLRELEEKENQTNRHVARFNESLSHRKLPTLRTSKLTIPINVKEGPKH